MSEYLFPKKHGVMFIYVALLVYFSNNILFADSGNLIPNGDFEVIQNNSPAHWSGLWTRDKGQGTLFMDKQVHHSGRYSVRIEHSGEKDWSLQPGRSGINVRPGELYVFEGWARHRGPGRAILSVVTYDSRGEVANWSFAERSISGRRDWCKIRSEFIIPPKIVRIQPRLIGYGRGIVWWDDLKLRKTGDIRTLMDKSIPDNIRLENQQLLLDFVVREGIFNVTDKRSGRIWRQKAWSSGFFPLQCQKENEAALVINWLDGSSGRRFSTRLELDAGKKAEVLVTIYRQQESAQAKSLVRPEKESIAVVSRQGEMNRALAYPYPFVTDKGTYLVVPMNEGISYPVDDPTIRPMKLITYGGHGICMSFWGVTNGEWGQMAIIETADDAAISIRRVDGKLVVWPEWEGQKGVMGYPRRIRYIFFDKGGYVAMCKRYRQYARQVGKFKTLEQKRQENPNVDLLIGAVNTWCWDNNPLEYVREMQSLGIKRILWSHRGQPATIREMNRMGGVLTSRYDIYQDLMDPEVARSKLRGVHSDWTQAGWPDDLMLDENGAWRRGWAVKGKDGKRYFCGVLCDSQALKYARQRVPADLRSHPYRCRFIDTTTASPWRECYSRRHPMTRSDSRHWKMELLRYMSGKMKLVTGSETGHDAAVPYVHYFEGMLSLGPYRVPDAGRNMIKPWEQVPERVAKFQLGQKYRLPLWELVYHDCVVAQWYWGDYNNKLPSLWDKRDLFNVLYGTPPMFMFNRAIWQKNKERFARSYKTICPTVRKVGYQEMLDFRLVTPDRNVQQSLFADGTTVTVNFGKQPYRLNGRELKGMDYRVREVTGLQRAHAHNDYEHERPLQDALAYGFGSVEADIHLINGQLLVAHDRKDAIPTRTLEKLYLEPLQERIKARQGRIYQNDIEFYLLIDIKTGAEPTYRVLRELLSKYADILTVVRDGEVRKGQVTVVISGNRPREMMLREKVRYCGYDGRLGDLDSDLPANFMPWISDNAANITRWRGQGQVPAELPAKLRMLVKKSHQKGRKLRLWGTPDNRRIWQMLYNAGVDLINTDDLRGLRRFLLEKEQQ